MNKYSKKLKKRKVIKIKNNRIKLLRLDKKVETLRKEKSTRLFRKNRLMCYPSNGKLKNKVECPSLAIKQIGALTVGGERIEEYC